MLPPIVKSVRLDCSPDRAFELFTSHIDKWWPLASHSISAGQGQIPADVQFEPYEGGRLYETAPDGSVHVWGSIAIWEPGSALRFSWHVGRTPDQATQIDVAFKSADQGGTLITLTHSNWEALGSEAADQHANYTPGWDQVFVQGFGAYAQKNLTATG